MAIIVIFKMVDIDEFGIFTVVAAYCASKVRVICMLHVSHFVVSIRFEDSTLVKITTKVSLVFQFNIF